MQMHLLTKTIHKNPLSEDVLSVCSTLHSPALPSDSALTLTLYSVPASSPIRTVEVVGCETEMVVALFQEVVPFLLYCTWYSVMATSLWGVVQLTFRDDVTVFIKETPMTLEGADRDKRIKQSTIITSSLMPYAGESVNYYDNNKCPYRRYRLTGTEQDNCYSIYAPQAQKQLIAADDALKLTIKSSLCLLYTPHSTSNIRLCSHSNIVFSASIQSSQNSRVCRR